MTRTPALLALLMSLPACATTRAEERPARVLMRESETLERAGDHASSAARARVAASLAPSRSVKLRLDIAEQLLDVGELERDYEHVERVLRFTEWWDARVVGRRRLRARDDELRYRLYRSGYETAFGPCLSVAPSSDRDHDGYPDARDGCPGTPEDFDSFEDQDGCPDRDNDGDGVLDAAELEPTGVWRNDDRRADDGRDCRNEPEDYDGVEDGDGCPEVEEAPEPEPEAQGARARALRALTRRGALPPDVLERLRRRARSRA